VLSAQGRQEARRILTVLGRIVRDTAVTRELKALYRYTCQVCQKPLNRGFGDPLVEGHHLQPGGQPHNGPDVPANVIILCPNHHALFDCGAITIDLARKQVIHADPADRLNGAPLNLRHEIGEEFVRYHNEHLFKGRWGENSPLLWEVFITQVQRLNPRAVDHLAAEELGKRLIRVRPGIEGNLAVWEHLKGFGRVFVLAEWRERNVRLIDFDQPSRNTYHVTDEFRFYNEVHRIRPDVAFLVNGIPVIIVETKAATKIEGIAEAFDQISRYHREGPELLKNGFPLRGDTAVGCGG